MKVELVTAFKQQTTNILADLNLSKELVLIIEHGKPLAYLVDVESYELMLKRLAILEGIAKGECAIFDGKILTHEQAKEAIS